MQTSLSPEYQARADGRAAEAILRKCVHCGFCTATCPTYQLLGDELDGPRGRIYLMKQVLEGVEPTRKTQLHLDRCLTCRNCETTCPSGVDYGHLIDIGRKIVDEKVPRPAAEKAVRWLLKEGLPSPLFGPAMKLGQMVRPLMPAALKNKVPATQDGQGMAGPRHRGHRQLRRNLRAQRGPQDATEPAPRQKQPVDQRRTDVRPSSALI
jgi:glycolate oxidase iron-sulfur subunit